MKLEVGKTYLTRDGSRVRILATDIGNKDYPIAGAVRLDDEEPEELLSWTKEGKYYAQNINDSYDLVKKYSFWNDVLKAIR